MVWALTLLSWASRARSGETVPPVPGTVVAVVPVDLEALPGRTAAAIYCVICHALPNPTDLDRRTWSEELLPKMR